MAFLTCKQFKDSQEEQDKKSISAEDALLDKSSGEGGGKVTVEKIKQAIEGDVVVAVKPNSGISGDGSNSNPLALDFTSADVGKSLLQALKDNGLLGDGLDVVDGKLVVKTVRSVDASGTILLGHYVDKE